jgi:hypothetical protein
MNHGQGSSLGTARGEGAASVDSSEAIRAVVAKTASMLAMTLRGVDQPKEKVDRKTDEVGPIVIDAVFEVGNDLGETDIAPSTAWRPIPRD